MFSFYTLIEVLVISIPKTFKEVEKTVDLKMEAKEMLSIVNQVSTQLT